MMRWEYKLIDLVLEPPVPGDEFEHAALALWDRALAEAGADGWEAVGTVTLTNGHGKHYPSLLLKRPTGAVVDASSG